MTTTSIILFLKPITDMLYQLSILDYAMTAIAVLALVINVKKIKKLFINDYIALSIVMLLTVTLMKTNFQGVTTYIKMISAYMLYFIGRACGGRLFKEKKHLVRAMILVLFANLITLFTRNGFQIWGHATTFSGLYFFKTDLALAMIYVIVTVLYFSRMKPFFVYSVCILSIVMIVLSNTRMDMLIAILVIGVYIFYIREDNTGKKLKINIKYVCIGVAVLFGGVILISNLLKLEVFRKFDYITFSVEKVFDIFSASNTSGRNVVWEHIINLFNKASFIDRLFGIDFVSDLYLTYDSHNAYIKMMYTSGYLGLALFILFILLYLNKLNSENNRKMFYFNLSLIITFVLQSISASTVAYTQNTWILMLFLGSSINNRQPLLIETNLAKKRSKFPRLKIGGHKK